MLMLVDRLHCVVDRIESRDGQESNGLLAQRTNACHTLPSTTRQLYQTRPGSRLDDRHDLRRRETTAHEAWLRPQLIPLLAPHP
jgi:hypothetical protein